MVIERKLAGIEEFGVGHTGGLPPDVVQKLRPADYPVVEFLANRDKIAPGKILRETARKSHTVELPHNTHIPHIIMEGFMTLRRMLPSGHEEIYPEKLSREKEKNGHTEAAVAGTAHIGKHPVALYGMNYDFFAGSLGVVEGNLFGRITRLATRRKIPLIGIYSSSGVRQQENYPALRQMRRITYEISRHQQRTNALHIAVLAGEVWGGISASAVPQGDLKIAFKGTNFGFTGPRLIHNFTGEKVPAGAQSAENHNLKRNNDIIVNDVDGLLRVTDAILTVAEHQKKKQKISAVDSAKLPPIRSLSRAERFRFDVPGFSNFFFDAPLDASEAQQVFPTRERRDVNLESLDQRLAAIEGNANRPDTEFLLQTCFENAIPLYNRFVVGNEARYPAIIAGIGYIGEQPFLVIGDQPSYKKVGDAIIKIPASPQPADFRYLRRMLKVGEKLGIPAVFFTDTPGASPTLDAEMVDQSGEISETLKATDNYKHPIVSMVTGELGSGGGLVTNPVVDKEAAFSRALIFVSHPKSAASILYNTDNPTPEQISMTINSLGITAVQQYELGLVDDILEEPFGGAESDPTEMARTVRKYIAETVSDYAEVSSKQLRKMREQKMDRAHGLALAHSS